MDIFALGEELNQQGLGELIKLHDRIKHIPDMIREAKINEFSRLTYEGEEGAKRYATDLAAISPDLQEAFGALEKLRAFKLDEAMAVIKSRAHTSDNVYEWVQNQPEELAKKLESVILRKFAAQTPPLNPHAHSDSGKVSYHFALAFDEAKKIAGNVEDYDVMSEAASVVERVANMILYAKLPAEERHGPFAPRSSRRVTLEYGQRADGSIEFTIGSDNPEHIMTLRKELSLHKLRDLH